MCNSWFYLFIIYLSIHLFIIYLFIIIIIHSFIYLFIYLFETLKRIKWKYSAKGLL